MTRQSKTLEGIEEVQDSAEMRGEADNPFSAPPLFP